MVSGGYFMHITNFFIPFRILYGPWTFYNALFCHNTCLDYSKGNMFPGNIHEIFIPRALFSYQTITLEMYDNRDGASVGDRP